MVYFQIRLTPFFLVLFLFFLIDAHIQLYGLHKLFVVKDLEEHKL